MPGPLRAWRPLAAALAAPFVVLAALLPSAAGQDVDTIPGCAGKDLKSRVISVRFKPVNEAALLVEQLLGPCGAYRVPKSLKVITVTDEPKILDRIAQAVASWDVPPRPVELTVSLILATREPPPKQALVDELHGVSEQLAQLTRFTRFERIGTASVRVMEGGTAEAEIGDRYHVTFRVEAIDPEHAVVRLEPFELFQRPAPNEAGAANAAPRRLLGMTVNLTEGRMNLVGASGRTNERALFLALTAWTNEAPQPAAAAKPGE